MYLEKDLVYQVVQFSSVQFRFLRLVFWMLPFCASLMNLYYTDMAVSLSDNIEFLPRCMECIAV